MTTEFLHAAWSARLKPAQKLGLIRYSESQELIMLVLE